MSATTDTYIGYIGQAVEQRKYTLKERIIAETLQESSPLNKAVRPEKLQQTDMNLSNMELYKHPAGTENKYANLMRNLCLSNRERTGKNAYYTINKRAVQFIRNNGRPVLTPINFYSTQNYVYRHGINSYRPPVDIGMNSQIEKALTKAAKRDTSPLKLTPMQEAFLRYVHPVRGIEFEEDYIRTVLNTPQYAAFVENLMTNPKFIIRTLS